MQELAGWAQYFWHDQFRLSDPPQLHRVLAGEALVQSVQRARKAFGQALEPRRLVEQMFAETGLHLEDLASDRIIFRVQPPIVCEDRSEEHTSELQSLMRISYAVFCLKKKKKKQH